MRSSLAPSPRCCSRLPRLRDGRHAPTGPPRRRTPRDWRARRHRRRPRRGCATGAPRSPPALAQARAAGHGADDRRAKARCSTRRGARRGADPQRRLSLPGDQARRQARRPARLCRLPRLRLPHPARTARLQGFAKLTGSQRPVGLIFPGDALRQVFLGTLVLGDETRAHAIWPRPRARRRRLCRADRRRALAAGAALSRVSNR